MKVMSWSEFRRLAVAELDDVLPLLVIRDGEPAYVIGKHDETIVLSDLAPLAQRNFRAMNNRIRTAMGQPERLYLDEFRAGREEEEPQEE